MITNGKTESTGQEAVVSCIMVFRLNIPFEGLQNVENHIVKLAGGLHRI
jgi:hypothetical protein